MDREMVRKALECIAEDRQKSCTGCEYSIFGLYPFCVHNIARDALALLKEQEEPKQIVRKQCKKEHEDGSIDYYAEWYCPHCNLLILRGFDNPSIKFCYKCGKPVLWEGR